MNKYLKERYDGILSCLPDDDAQVVREAHDAALVEGAVTARRIDRIWSTVLNVAIVAIIIGLCVVALGFAVAQERITRAVNACEAEQQELRDRCLDCLLGKP